MIRGEKERLETNDPGSAAVVGYEDILKTLHAEHFSQASRSRQVTSSHWATIGGHDVHRDGDEWRAEGFGFGNFVRDTALERVKRVSVSVLVNRLLRRMACTEAVANNGRALAKSQGRIFDFDCAKQVLSLDTVFVKALRVFGRSGVSEMFDGGIRTICVIGDGYGYLGGLVKSLDPRVRVLSVNLGRTLFFDVYYTRKARPNDKVTLPRTREQLVGAMEGSDFVFIEAENCEWLAGCPIDVFFNIASMQEMNVPIVRRYLSLMRASAAERVFFYCCNRVSKTLPDGEVVRFDDYGWHPYDETVLDELCPWYQRYPSPVPPFWRPFDGPIRHRLVQLQKGGAKAEGYRRHVKLPEE